MQPEKCEKKLVVVFIRMNVIVENQRKKDDYHTYRSGKKSLSQFKQPRSTVNIIVESGDIVKKNPERGDKKETQKITVGKFNGNIDAKPLGLYNCFPVDIKCSPAKGCSYEVENQIFGDLPFPVHHSRLSSVCMHYKYIQLTPVQKKYCGKSKFFSHLIS
jgi:hypothetical protein